MIEFVLLFVAFAVLLAAFANFENGELLLVVVFAILALWLAFMSGVVCEHRHQQQTKEIVRC